MMKRNIINVSIAFGILAGINLGCAVALEFHPLNFIVSVIMIAVGIHLINRAIHTEKITDKISSLRALTSEQP